MTVGLLVRHAFTGRIGVIVRVISDHSVKSLWCEVLHHTEEIEGYWDTVLEVV